MRVLRGTLPDPVTDHRRTREMVERVVETDELAIRVWYPPRQVAFGRRDRRADGYEQARTIARDRGYPVTEREVGGRAVVFTGTGLALALAHPTGSREGPDTGGIRERYDRVGAAVQNALEELGATVEGGEPPDSFCPGTHSLRADGKVAGLAQRVRREVAVVGGYVVVDDHGTVADVLAPIYDAIGVPFDRDSVGSLARAGGETDPELVRRTVEAAVAPGGDPSVVNVRET